ncbi:hypothetical protein B0T26DRAFT_724213 [Lasiosphaeria miniovina]|uniref:Uncharacterized protein n=1 Tax=Lasiosphaeria miniovina TaxID=1954250 RepID=A0AA40DQW1_9PEZI|nr:uncharacterized protein B0T26DRAFT_724213 [Lasiosphaeria miniovina]KAK0710151.1 hypothetical protein B0T26DRAFT_724213 [Lasiosphaeria miniovina]
MQAMSVKCPSSILLLAPLTPEQVALFATVTCLSACLLDDFASQRLGLGGLEMASFEASSREPDRPVGDRIEDVGQWRRYLSFSSLCGILRWCLISLFSLLFFRLFWPIE